MSVNRCCQVSFFGREQREQFAEGTNCIFSIAYISMCIQTIHSILTEHKSLCSHKGRRPLEANHWDNTQVLQLQPAKSGTQIEQCLLIAANGLHSYGCQKKQHTLSAGRSQGPAMKTLSPVH